jgi:nucleoside-diphosphate-sugar epimerase
MALLKGLSVLVTGATGTVGSVVAHRLAAEGMRVRAMARRSIAPRDERIEPVIADLIDPAAVLEAVRGIEFTVHCAGSLSSDENICRSVNVEGTRNLVEALVAVGCKRLVHISSISVYDMRTCLDLSEETPLWSEPVRTHPYGRTKAEAERVVAASGHPAVILRPTPVLSLHPSSFWGPLALERARAMNGPVFSCTELPFVHVENLAEAVVLAVRTDCAVGQAYDVLDFHGSTDAFLRAVAAAIGRPAARLSPNAPRMRVAGERIRRELGYAPIDRFHEFLAALSDSPRR